MFTQRRSASKSVSRKSLPRERKNGSVTGILCEKSVAKNAVRGRCPQRFCCSYLRTSGGFFSERDLDSKFLKNVTSSQTTQNSSQLVHSRKHSDEPRRNSRKSTWWREEKCTHGYTTSAMLLSSMFFVHSVDKNRWTSCRSLQFHFSVAQCAPLQLLRLWSRSERSVQKKLDDVFVWN